jgi:hypothetical protein
MERNGVRLRQPSSKQPAVHTQDGQYDLTIVPSTLRAIVSRAFSVPIESERRFCLLFDAFS